MKKAEGYRHGEVKKPNGKYLPLKHKKTKEEFMKAYRHGDLCLIEVGKLPEGLKKSNSKVLMTGSGGNPHSYTDGEFYPTNIDVNVFGYFVAGKNCKLYHIEHGDKKEKGIKACQLPKNIYQLRRQIEDTHEGMKVVED